MRLKSDYNGATQVDESYKGSASSEADIREARRKIQPKIAGLENFEKDMINTFRTKFDKWTAVECLAIERQAAKVSDLSRMRTILQEAFE